MPIPWIIHQILQQSVSAESLQLVNRIRKLHPDFVHEVWNDSRVRDLLRDKFVHLLVLYNNLAHPTQKYHLAVYCVLAQHGGYVISPNTVSKAPLLRIDDVEMHNMEFVCNSSYGSFGDVIGSIPHSNVLTKCLQLMLQRSTHSLAYSFTIPYSSGYLVIKSAMKAHPYRAILTDVIMANRATVLQPMWGGSEVLSWLVSGGFVTVLVVVILLFLTMKGG